MKSMSVHRYCAISCHSVSTPVLSPFPQAHPLPRSPCTTFFQQPKWCKLYFKITYHFSQMNASRYVLSNWLILTMSTDLIAFLHNDLICKSFRHARDRCRLRPQISRFVSRAVIWPRHAITFQCPSKGRSENHYDQIHHLTPESSKIGD